MSLMLLPYKLLSQNSNLQLVYRTKLNQSRVRRMQKHMVSMKQSGKLCVLKFEHLLPVAAMIFQLVKYAGNESCALIIIISTYCISLPVVAGGTGQLGGLVGGAGFG